LKYAKALDTVIEFTRNQDYPRTAIQDRRPDDQTASNSAVKMTRAWHYRNQSGVREKFCIYPPQATLPFWALLAAGRQRLQSCVLHICRTRPQITLAERCW
jgi:hypothetical protein